MFTLFPALALTGTSVEIPAERQASASEKKAEKAKKICRAGGVTGTRMTNRICKTQAEWDAMNEGAQGDLGSRASHRSGGAQ